MKRQTLLVIIIFLIIIVSPFNNSISEIYYSLNSKIEKQNSKFNLKLKLEILAPLNDTIYYPTPENPVHLIYTIQPQNANISIWLNSSLVVNEGNFTVLPLFFRANYNLTVQAEFINDVITKRVFLRL